MTYSIESICRRARDINKARPRELRISLPMSALNNAVAEALVAVPYSRAVAAERAGNLDFDPRQPKGSILDVATKNGIPYLALVITIDAAVAAETGQVRVRPIPNRLRHAPGEEGQETIGLVLYGDGTCHVVATINPSHLIERECRRPAGKYSEALDFVEIFQIQRERYPGRRYGEGAGYPAFDVALKEKRRRASTGVETAKLRLFRVAACIAERAGWKIRDDDLARRQAMKIGAVNDQLVPDYGLAEDLEKILAEAQLRFNVTAQAGRRENGAFVRTPLGWVRSVVHHHWLLGTEHEHDILELYINDVDLSHSIAGIE